MKENKFSKNIMSHTAMAALHSVAIIRSAARPARGKPKPKPQEMGTKLPKRPSENRPITESTSTQANPNPGFGSRKKEPVWHCIQNCGACCKLDKGPSFPSPEEIFDDPVDVEKYKSLIGPDGWCVHLDKSSRSCTIYAERPYFCRVEPDVFETLYGIDKKKFNKEACSCCIDTIKTVYGSKSEELNSYNQAIWNSPG